jgi:hypothetical protein
MRSLLRVVLLVELPLLIAVGVVVTATRSPAGAVQGPERVAASVAGCDVTTTRGAAQVTYTVANATAVEHAYRVEVVVDAGATVVGSTVSLVNRVAPGTTVTGRAMIPLRGPVTAPSCVVHATTFDGHAGHHGSGDGAYRG